MDNTLSIDLDHVARELGLPLTSVERTVALLDEGNTVPFITRYRKDHTAGLDEEQIRQIEDRVLKMRLLTERKQTILKSIESQGKLTLELAGQIKSATSIKRLEDLYLPFKPKKQTLATLARERGLEPLATEIHDADPAAANLDARAADFVNPDKKVNSIAEVLLGVGHLLAERFSERADLRGRLRKILRHSGKLVCTRVAPSGKADGEKAETDKPEGDATEVTEIASTAAGEANAAAASLPDAGTSIAGSPIIADDSVTAEIMPVDDESAEGEQDDALLELGEDPSLEEEEDSAEVAEAEAEAEEAAASEAAAGEGMAAIAAGETAGGEGAGGEAGTAAGSAPAGEKGKRSKKKKKEKSIAQGKADRKADLKKKKQEHLESSFKDYFEFQEAIGRLPPHRVLAINRGERARILRVKIESDLEAMVREAEQLLVPAEHPHADFLKGCVRDALTRLIVPSLEREARRELTETAEDHAVEVFARNLRKLLLQPPVHGHRVLAADPGFRSGCKLAALDEFGNVLGQGVIHLVGKAERKQQGRKMLIEMVKLHRLNVIAIGNGTACRETEQLVAEVLSDELKDSDVAYVVVNEAGASVYSTSPLGREELPQHDATLRSSVSIGRRLLDPLSELVKITPANIGVGLYQHDLKSKPLQTSLDHVVESCVNYVGVDVNTASPSLLRYVSGLNQLTARRLYDYRCEHGPFRNREQFRDVPGFGESAFVQAAGFLKITGGDNPLDCTWIHPESYDIAKRVLEKLGSDVSALATRVTGSGLAAVAEAAQLEVGNPDVASTDLPVAETPLAEVQPGEIPTPSAAQAGEATAPSVEPSPVTAESEPSPLADALSTQVAAAVSEGMPAAPSAVNAAREALAAQAAAVNVPQLAAELGVGELLLTDMLASLTRPGRDPREDLPPPVFRRGIMKLEDLKPAMELTGTVLNVVDFGAFVDIGLHDSGLVHISRLADRYIRDPHEVVSVGDVLKVWVVEVDKQRRRVSLTAIQPGTEKPPQQRRGKPEGGRPERSFNKSPSGSAPAAEGAAVADGQPQPAHKRPQGRRPQRPAGAPSGGSQSGGSRGGRDKQPFTPRPKFTTPRQPPKPVVPLTKAMKEGKAPMRTFSDLMQFFTTKDKEEGTEGEGKK